MSLADLIALGAPALPEGHFYRVRESTFLRGCVEVSIRLEGRFWSWEVDETLVDVTADDDPARGIVEACVFLVKRQEQRLREISRWKTAERWIGDHR